MSLIGATRHGHVVVTELLAGPHNFASEALMNELADALMAAEADGARAGVICSASITVLTLVARSSPHTSITRSLRRPLSAWRSSSTCGWAPPG